MFWKFNILGIKRKIFSFNIFVALLNQCEEKQFKNPLENFDLAHVRW